MENIENKATTVVLETNIQFRERVRDEEKMRSFMEDTVRRFMVTSLDYRGFTLSVTAAGNNESSFFGVMQTVEGQKENRVVLQPMIIEKDGTANW